ncbi:MAG: hypothetical protein AB1451_12495 [Nitrospirota bacterium]
MKQSMIVAGMVLLIWGGVAAAGMDDITGEVTKMEGEMVTVKMGDGSMKTIHVDPKGTKKEGEVKVGAHVTANVTPSSHANWIKVMKGDGMMKDGMKKDEMMKDGMKKDEMKGDGMMKQDGMSK